MSVSLIVLIVIVLLVVLLVIWGIRAYNGLVNLRNRVANGWAQIDVQLKQRADLVPNLVQTVGLRLTRVHRPGGGHQSPR